MPRERETTFPKIKVVDYDINGNKIRAYYGGARKLIFVLDETINADKPNVLLVIDSFDNRKWDDILVNDYGIDLETIRPKKDNKYQKLDIEYGGLDVYSELIDAYDSDDDLNESLENLERFRIMAARRAAKERLAAAEDVAAKSRETIERTNETISELRARIKSLRAKLAEQKRGIGREPTKASAAKILKTEAQLDATNEKLARAKKRLTSAQRRLVTAEDDAEIARAILARHANVNVSQRAMRPARARKPVPVVTRRVADDEPGDDYVEYPNEEDTDETYDDETAADEMSGNDAVKPLFDTDPEILDDNIAFKPIEFDAHKNNAVRDVSAESYAEPVVAPAPLSFTPPSNSNTSETRADESAMPMLDSLTTVEQIEPNSDETISVVESNVDAADAGVVAPVKPAPESVTEIETVEQITPIEPVTPVRPVSPISGNVTVQTDVRYNKKPTLVYYIMLILLIILSVFTLWLYQSKNGAVLPDLAATNDTPETATVTEPEPTETNIPSPFVAPTVDTQKPVVVIESETITAETPVADTETVAEPEPEPVVVSEPEIVNESEPVSVDVVAEPDNVVVESPFVDLRTVANYEPDRKPIPTEEEILSRKPGYSVSQNDKMFVAAPEYETETVVSSNYSLDTDVQPMPATMIGGAPEIVASEVLESVSETCSDGEPADEYGCCSGEIYIYTADGYMCCVGDDCFPPLR